MAPSIKGGGQRCAVSMMIEREQAQPSNVRSRRREDSAPVTAQDTRAVYSPTLPPSPLSPSITQPADATFHWFVTAYATSLAALELQPCNNCNHNRPPSPFDQPLHHGQCYVTAEHIAYSPGKGGEPEARLVHQRVLISGIEGSKVTDHGPPCFSQT